jgi:hypothetical protein
LQVVRGFQTAETKRLCARVEAGTTVVSDGGQWFQCIAWQPGIIHERHVTDSDRTAARHPAFRWANTVLANVKNSLLATHRAGNLWVSSNGPLGYAGVTVWNPVGSLIGRIRLPEVCANLCFAGPKRDYLFMCGS